MSEPREDSLQNNTEIEVIDARERWSEYRLADGTTMRIKSVVIAVFREDGHQTAGWRAGLQYEIHPDH